MASPSPSVIIDISKDITSGDGPGSITYTVHNGENGGQVSLTKEEDPQGSGFFKLTHSPSNRVPRDTFTVKEVRYGGADVQELRHDENILYLAVWYWEKHDGLNTPLLVEVKIQGGTYKYYTTKGNGNSWTSDIDPPSPLTDDELERKLEYLNCQHNKAATLDISLENSQKHANSSRYCCSKHENDGEAKVSVSEVPVYCQVQNHKSTSNITAYKHSISDSYGKLSGIKFYENDGQDKRRNIKLKEVSFPNIWCQSIYAFYCEKRDPVLIYVDSSVQTNVQGWYKKNPPNDDNVTWIKLQGIPDDIKPETINNCSNKEINTLVEVLSNAGCPNLGRCAVTPEKAELAAAQQGDSDTRDSQTNSSNWQVILAVLTGTGVVSGLVGFAGYKFYQSFKGDPWVRQIWF
ncbi:hypothetical protein BEWA_016730 [Theileria equi strain WA]|uniref:Uncharacterized protein n=1 Tax=Theileria equi strain WA TaxID=1537102 RepID=L1L9Y0_THEEQ|nr:hypothetical protein BEWA_016730 [Theileria equi strain WA]EKX71995.1 hypothetical protein BEWA_016730 [Theileria equi strain WA]|eukprot:XP_004831447.1 hypothetical protein BEWA_016730 [Theileria equi strain WA]